MFKMIVFLLSFMVVSVASASSMSHTTSKTTGWSQTGVTGQSYSASSVTSKKTISDTNKSGSVSRVEGSKVSGTSAGNFSEDTRSTFQTSGKSQVIGNTASGYSKTSAVARTTGSSMTSVGENSKGYYVERSYQDGVRSVEYGKSSGTTAYSVEGSFGNKTSTTTNSSFLE